MLTAYCTVPSDQEQPSDAQVAQAEATLKAVMGDRQDADGGEGHANPWARDPD